MSAVHPDDALHTNNALDLDTTVEEDTFTAVTITESRLHVLGALTQQALDHFGHGPLFMTNVSVVPCALPGDVTHFLASADFVVGE